jgi:chromosome segregation protein
VGGRLAGYNEISVKRQVARDGISVYYLNGTRCRRKDVRDLFLGTGLGSRSYSIIEQGMISEVVDARPEEIRGHLEEAAGISRYKERRRETENRIRHTRDNLARLSDLREEVGKHLGRLKRQANAANRYRKLKQQRRELESRLMSLHWRDLKTLVEKGALELSARETALQESIANQRSTEASLEKLHQDQAQATEAFGEVQGDLYEVASEIARLEQTIAHARELQTRQKQEFEETKSSLDDLEKHMVLDRAQVEELTSALAKVEPALETALEAEGEATDLLHAADGRVAEWQNQFEEYHRLNGEVSSGADGKRAEIEVLDQRLLQSARRLEALDREAESVDTADLQGKLKSLGKASKEFAREERKQQDKLDKLSAEQSKRQAALRKSEDRVRELQRELHMREGRHESLQALQQASLADDGSRSWLKKQGFASAPRLAQAIEVEKGWETAVETVLGHWLQSVVVNAQAKHGKALAELETAALSLLSDQGGKLGAVKGSLASKVRAPDVIIAWLNEVQLATSLDEAWKAREKLSTGESLITQKGEWIGNGWVRVARSQAGQQGMLSREQEIARLEQEIGKLRVESEDLAAANENERKAIEQQAGGFNELQSEINKLHRKRNELDGQLESRQANIDLMDTRQHDIAEETERLRAQIKEDEKAVKQARGKLEVLLEQMASLKQQRDALETQRAVLMEEREAARCGLGEAREKRHDLALKTGSRRASLDSLRQSLERMDTQISQLQQRYLSLSEQIARSEQPEKTHAGEMDKLLQRRVETDSRLGLARQKLDELEEAYRQLDSSRQQAIQQSDEIRQDLERSRLQQQEIELNARNIQRQVEALGAEVSELASALPEDAESEVWEAELEGLQKRITQLEPVNLAAIQEFEEEKKRKDYLDAQNEDLCEALTTLENAIAKIDRKTRTRFKETFEKVNKGVQELFPRLFGGGHAYLELTGEDLLTTGVSIMARPPGKRVSSIHLLSGGEKALTAVAFVFSIFQLNPAPFCLLDEVDAPLDDSNVSRFSSMVREMSESVQFVIVTHNKITMEMMHQMSGVTMQEPGVSRLVQVDVEEAAQLAATA